MGQESQTQKTIGFNTVGRKTRPRDHIWAKTIYGIQHSGTGKSDPKDDRIQHSWQENQTQRPYMGKDHMGFNTVGQGKSDPKDAQLAGKPDPKSIYGQRPYGQIPYMGFNTVGTGKLDPKTIYRILIGKWVALMVAKRMYLVRILLEVGK